MTILHNQNPPRTPTSRHSKVASLSALLRAQPGKRPPRRLNPKPTMKVASLNPSRLAPSFSLADEPLSTLAGDAQVDLRQIPRHFVVALSSAIRYAERNSERRLEIGKGAALAALARHGLHQLENTAEVAAWRELTEQLGSPDFPEFAQIRVHSLIHGAHFELSDAFDSGRSRLPFRCSETVRLELFGAADRVFGCSGAALFTATVAHSLSQSPGVARGFQEKFAADVSRFLASYQRRAEEIAVVLRMVEEKSR